MDIVYIAGTFKLDGQAGEFDLQELNMNILTTPYKAYLHSYCVHPHSRER